jgi:hypothetical protein
MPHPLFLLVPIFHRISSCFVDGLYFLFRHDYFAEGKKVTKVYLSSYILQLLKLSKVANNNKTMGIQYLFNCIEKR